MTECDDLCIKVEIGRGKFRTHRLTISYLTKWVEQLQIDFGS